MKALILAAGKGTRLLPLTDNIPKPLIPLCNLPTLLFVVDKIFKSGIKDIGLVISPVHKEYFYEFMKQYSLMDSIELIFQNEPLGVAHAVKEAKGYINQEDFLLYLGDNLIQDDLGPYRKEFQQGSTDALLLLKEIEDPSKFGVAQLGPNGKLIGIEEKPIKPKSNLAVTGLYFFKNKIFNEIEKIKFSERGELEITDAISSLMTKKNIVGRKLYGWWIDTGSREQILEANSFIMDQIFSGKFTNLYENYEFTDRILLGENSNIENVKTEGHAIIGHNSNIYSTRLSNGVTIGDKNIIKDSSVFNSIILDGNNYNNCEIINSIIDSGIQEGVNNRIIDIIET
tara:strand:+ start:2874 stop:3899 length:1026 start_codon:yes stop_codon:yes gene_type:complete